MIPRRLRLPRNKIAPLFKKGDKAANDFFTIRYRTSTGALSDSYCVIVSAATEKSAVKRNGVRRRIYEILRLKQKTRAAKGKPREIAIICKKKVCASDYGTTEKKLNELLNKLPG